MILSIVDRELHCESILKHTRKPTTQVSYHYNSSVDY